MKREPYQEVPEPKEAKIFYLPASNIIPQPDKPIVRLTDLLQHQLLTSIDDLLDAHFSKTSR